MKKIFVPVLFIVLIMLSQKAFSQSVDVKYTITDAYPVMVSSFKLMGPVDEIRNNPPNILIKKEDVEIYEMEDGQKVRREVLEDPVCPKNTQTTFSAILTVDISTSMESPSSNGTQLVEIVKEVLKDWINKFDPLRCETAITAFCGDAVSSPKDQNQPIHNFSTDKASLLQAVKDMPPLCSGTNYNAAFLYKRFDTFVKNLSALWYCKPDVARYKPVIIFLTDGNHLSQWGGNKDGGAFQINEVINLANQRNATIYVIVVGEEVISKPNKDNLDLLATIGKGFDDTSPNIWMNINDADELKGIYDEILEEAGKIGSPPDCYATWVAACDGGSATFSFPNHDSVSDVSDYSVNPQKKPNLSLTPRNLSFLNKAPITPSSQTITLKAEKNFVVLDSLIFQKQKDVRGGRYRIIPSIPPPITIPKDSTYKIIIEYTPVDSNYSAATFDFKGFACTGYTGTVYAEMRPFIELIDMGNADIDDSVEKTFTMVFCNKTGKKIKAISRPTLSGTDADNFEIVSPTTTFTVDTGACQTFTFKFKPKEPAGTKTAKININNDYGGTSTLFTGTITGNAIGGKTLTNVIPIFDSTHCNLDSVDTEIIIVNSGAVTIKVDSCRILPPGNAVFTEVSSCPSSIAPGKQETITVRFKPTALQNNDFTGTLRVYSDADNNPYDVPLIGPMRNIAYSLSPSPSLDFGDICVGAPKTQQITIQNDGNVELNVNVKVNAPFSVSPDTYTIPVGANRPVDVVCNPLADGSFNSNFDVINTECNITKTMSLSARGVKPLIQLDKQISQTAVVGDTDEVTVVITNKSASDLILANIVPADNVRFKVIPVDAVPPPNVTIPPNGTLTFKLQYIPQPGDVTVLTSGLEFIGATCGFDTTVDITGNPGQATVNIEIDEYTGYAGTIIEIPVFLRSGFKFDQSNTKLVSTDIRYDGSLLEVQPPFIQNDDPIPPFKIIKIIDRQVKATNSEQAIDTLKFLVKPSAAVSTPLEILNTSGNGGAQFIKNDGLFTLDAGAAIVSIDTISALAGEEIKIKVKLRSTKALPAINGNIMVKVSFNASMLEPVGLFIAKDTLDLANRKRIVTYKLPLAPAIGNVLAELHFNTMLGTSSFTDLFIDSLWVAKGNAVLTKANGLFIMNGICKDNESSSRYFNPFQQVGLLSLKPNPSDGMVDVVYEISEKGYTHMWLSDILGNPVLDLVNEVPETGEASLRFDGTKLSDGVYFVILQTPVQVFSKKLYIV